jgi:phosphoglycolate phosphatase
MRADGIIFDKDGTLFDFRATWNVWAAGVIAKLAAADAVLARAIAQALHFDLDGQTFRPTSPVIAGTLAEVTDLIAPHLPQWPAADLEAWLDASAQQAPLAPAVALDPLLSGLRARGLRLGVMTNDSAAGAQAHLGAAGVTHLFDMITGFDSGWGAKPDPAPLLAFARAMALDPARVVMVGDSTHDLIAGRRAGMQTVAVLTGMAEAAELSPHADAVLPDIGHLPVWLAD